jgi:hypothetical protein
VEDETGNQYMEVGRALDRAMLEYMTGNELTEINEQAQLNEALLRKILDRLDGEKEKEITTDTTSAVPKGKDPGSRRQREAYVIHGIIANGFEQVKLPTLKQAIKETAEVSSERTIKDYVEAITSTAAFQSHPRKAETWVVDYDGAREVLSNRNVALPEGIEA